LLHGYPKNQNIMADPIKIFIVDDHPLFRDGLISYLANTPDFHVAGTAADGMEALNKLKNLQADVVLTDIQMPKMNGIEFTEEVLKTNPGQKIMILTMFSEVAFIKKLLQLGVNGYILKDIGREDLYQAIRAVHEGGHYYSREITEVMMNKIRGVTQKSFNYITDLTERERELLYLILSQKSNQEIADELFISPRTVEAHKRNMLSKTGSKNVAGLVIFALENNIFPDFK